jgi:hypothetical protein
VRFAVFLLVLSAAGVVGGASLIGRWALGLAIVAVSLGLGWWALFGEVAEKPVRGDQLDLIRQRRAS